MLYICSEIVVFGRKNALYDSGKIVFRTRENDKY